MCGLFCSTPPVGTMTVVLPARIRCGSSTQVRSSIITELSGGGAFSSLRAVSRARRTRNDEAEPDGDQPADASRRFGAFGEPPRDVGEGSEIAKAPTLWNLVCSPSLRPSPWSRRACGNTDGAEHPVPEAEDEPHVFVDVARFTAVMDLMHPGVDENAACSRAPLSDYGNAAG